MNSIFEKYKRDESCDKAQAWLEEYWYWRDEAEKKKITLGSPSFDGQPKAKTYDPDRRMIDWTNAQNEWKRRELVLKYIASKGGRTRTICAYTRQSLCTSPSLNNRGKNETEYL